MRQMSTIFLIFLLKYSHRAEIQPVSGDQFVFNAVPQTFHRQCMTGTVQVTIITLPYIVAFHKVNNFLAFIAFILGWIMQKDDLWQCACTLQRCFKTEQFPLEDLFIVLSASILLKKPATGAANGVTFIFIVIIV